MKKAEYLISSLGKNNFVRLNSEVLLAKGILGAKLLFLNSQKFVFANKKELKGWFSNLLNLLESLHRIYAVNLVTVGIGYKFFTPRHPRFLSSIVLKMGFGGSELCKKVNKDLRARARKNKLLIIGSDKSKVGSFAKSIIDLKRPIPYTGKGIKYKEQNVFLKKRKQQQKSK
jgi:large subunit ribosomal protein L6